MQNLYVAILMAFLCSLPTHIKCTDCPSQNPTSIPGPKIGDRIAVVGAGPAGIHIALALKKKGFKKVTILEASCRIGGKSLTLHRRGAPQDMGTVYMQPDYLDNVIKLANIYSYSRLINLTAPSVWATPGNMPQSFNGYILTEVSISTGIVDPVVLAGILALKIWEYIDLHRALFCDYPYELMPRPNATTLIRIRGTAIDFLLRENLELLIPLFHASHTIQGYGQLDQVAAFYLLLWNTPNLMGALLLRLMNAPSIGVFLFEDGFQGLWKKIARVENLKISFSREVVKLRRTKKKVYITTVNKFCGCRSHKHPGKKSCKRRCPNRRRHNRYGKRKGSKGHRRSFYQPYCQRICPTHKYNNIKYSCYKKRGLVKTDIFDFVMWTPELKESLRIIDATPLEKRLFSRTKPTFFTTTLIDETGAKRGLSPVDFFFNNVRSPTNIVWANRDSYSTIREIQGVDYQAGNTVTGNDNAMKLRTSVAYQMALFPPCPSELNRKLVRHYRNIRGTIQVIRRKIWRYFPRYSPRNIQKGIVWDIVEAQGRKKMWYLGSSVIFESAKSVIEYNKLLLNLASPP